MVPRAILKEKVALSLKIKRAYAKFYPSRFSSFYGFGRSYSFSIRTAATGYQKLYLELMKSHSREWLFSCLLLHYENATTRLIFLGLRCFFLFLFEWKSFGRGVYSFSTQIRQRFSRSEKWKRYTHSIPLSFSFSFSF